MIYLGLFGAAFLAATILPAQSEAVLVAALLAGEPWGLVVLVASLGNILGAAVSYGMGYAAGGLRRSAPETAQPRLHRVTRAWIARYGIWSLLLSWVPLVGDALVLAAGALRWPLLPALALIALGKVARYLAITALTLS